MAETATTRRKAKLAQILRQGRFNGAATDELVDEIEKLYGKTAKPKPRAKSPAKS